VRLHPERHLHSAVIIGRAWRLVVKVVIPAGAAISLIAAPPASALISLTAGTVSPLSPFGPAKTATASGTLVATDTNTSWTLQAQDTGTGAGKMVAAATGCTGSDARLTNAIGVSVTSTLSGVTSAGTIALSASNQTVASSTSTSLTATTLTSNYSQVIPGNQVMLAGCTYSLSVTYTLQ
jgi:hypothetical protein